jgi:hypothetical protein
MPRRTGPARSRIRNQDPGVRLQVHKQVPCLLSGPGGVRVRIHAPEWNYFPRNVRPPAWVEPLIAEADTAVRIPMNPAARAAGVDSLHVVAAAAIACHLLAR